MSDDYIWFFHYLSWLIFFMGYVGIVATVRPRDRRQGLAREMLTRFCFMTAIRLVLLVVAGG